MSDKYMAAAGLCCRNAFCWAVLSFRHKLAYIIMLYSHLVGGSIQSGTEHRRMLQVV